MASFKEKLFFEKPPAVLMLAFQDAARKMDLKVMTQERFRLVVFEVPLQTEVFTLPISIEVKIAALSEGTGVELKASNPGFGAAQTQRVKEKVEEYKKLFYSELEKPAIEEERLAKIRAREQREAEERAKEDEEEAKRESLYQSKVAQMKAEEEAALLRRLPSGAASNDPIDRELARRESTASSSSRASSSSSSSGGVPSLAEELQRLAELRDNGILDDEEFKAAKRALLNKTY